MTKVTRSYSDTTVFIKEFSTEPEIDGDGDIRLEPCSNIKIFIVSKEAVEAVKQQCELWLERNKE